MATSYMAVPGAGLNQSVQAKGTSLYSLAEDNLKAASALVGYLLRIRANLSPIPDSSPNKNPEPPLPNGHLVCAQNLNRILSESINLAEEICSLLGA